MSSLKQVKHTPDDMSLIIAALIGYRQQFIEMLRLAGNSSETDKAILQSEINRVNALLNKYSY